MQVVLVHMEAKKFGDHVGHCPLGSENLCQVFNVVNGCLSNRINAVT